MNIKLLTPRFGGPYNWGRQLEHALIARGVAVRRVANTAALVTSPLRPWGDVTHAAVPLPWQRGSVPMVLTVKGDFRNENNVWKYLYPRAIRRANTVTVPSMFLKDILGIDRAVVIPNAIHLDEYPERTVQHHDKMRILIATKFYFPEKAEGVVRLLNILHHTPLDVKNSITIQIIGEGPLLNDVQKRSTAFSLPITFLGHQDTKAYLYQSDIFLYYSLHDNMPNVILEAMAAGLPVMTNSVGAVTEMIRTGTDGVIAESDEEYLHHLIKLASDINLRKRIGQQARNRIVQDFNWEHVVGQYMNIYQSVV